MRPLIRARPPRLLWLIDAIGPRDCGRRNVFLRSGPGWPDSRGRLPGLYRRIASPSARFCCWPDPGAHTRPGVISSDQGFILERTMGRARCGESRGPACKFCRRSCPPQIVFRQNHKQSLREKTLPGPVAGFWQHLSGLTVGLRTKAADLPFRELDYLFSGPSGDFPPTSTPRRPAPPVAELFEAFDVREGLWPWFRTSFGPASSSGSISGPTPGAPVLIMRSARSIRERRSRTSGSLLAKSGFFPGRSRTVQPVSDPGPGQELPHYAFQGHRPGRTKIRGPQIASPRLRGARPCCRGRELAKFWSSQQTGILILPRGRYRHADQD